MAVVKAPLMSMDASGTVAGSVVFSKWKGINYVRRHAIPANPKSGLQVGVREMFKFITQDWSNWSAGEKANWDDLAAASNITPLNAAVANAVNRARRNLGALIDPDTETAETVDDPINTAITAQPKTLVLTWEDPAANEPDWMWLIYMSTTMGFTPDISNLVAIVREDVFTATIPNLITGTEYYFRMRGANKAGQLGDLAVEFNEAPT